MNYDNFMLADGQDVLRLSQNRLTVLFRMNMTAVAHQAHFLFQKSICPISQTSRTSGWRRQNSQSTSDLQLRTLDTGEGSGSGLSGQLTCTARCRRQRQLGSAFSQAVSAVAWKAGVRSSVVEGATNVPRDQSKDTV